MSAFAGRLQDTVDLDTARLDLTRAVDRALSPTHISVWTSPR